jgi:hypothetical protein
MPLMKLVQNPFVCLGDANAEAILFEEVGQTRDKSPGLIVEHVTAEREVQHFIDNLVVFLIVHQFPSLRFQASIRFKQAGLLRMTSPTPRSLALTA